MVVEEWAQGQHRWRYELLLDELLGFLLEQETSKHVELDAGMAEVPHNPPGKQLDDALSVDASGAPQSLILHKATYYIIYPSITAALQYCSTGITQPQP